MKFYITIDVVNENMRGVTNLRVTGNSFIEVLSKLPLAIKELEQDLERLEKRNLTSDDDIPF